MGKPTTNDQGEHLEALPCVGILASRDNAAVAALNRRLQVFRHLHSCSGCFRLERLPGATFTHWKTPPCHGAHPK
jgi:hypothetical protein